MSRIGLPVICIVTASVVGETSVSAFDQVTAIAGPPAPSSGTYYYGTGSYGLTASPIPRQTVSFNGNYEPGTVVVSTQERRLYFVLGNGQAIRYAAGVGREGFEWSGTKTVTAKREWPDWHAPIEMLKRRPDLPRYMAGGIGNPLGARALYLGSSLYRIHGSDEPGTIGQAVSSGCIRLSNEDVIDLYERVKVGTRVVVV
jgi:lipoprotein-anchoring transpeptidase ErfK/SrfK